MTETVVGVNRPAKEPSEQPSAQELETARELVRQARDRGVALTGPDGLLKALTKTVIETARDEEMSEHLGYDKHEPAGRGSPNSRNGKRSKTVLTDACGDVEIDVPRDRASTRGRPRTPRTSLRLLFLASRAIDWGFGTGPWGLWVLAAGRSRDVSQF